MSYDPDVVISLLIGNNCPSIVRPREALVGGDDEPYGHRSSMGWGITGRVCEPPDCKRNKAVCNKAFYLFDQSKGGHQSTEDSSSPWVRFCRKFFKEQALLGRRQLISHNPREWNKKERDGHYKMTLPLQSDCHSLPFNCQLAVKRWNQLLARFRKNPKFLEDYQALMTEIIELCAEKTNKTNKPRCTKLCASHWGVSPPEKRVVFDCLAQYEGVSLNNHLLQGPDQTNTLLGILCRFREESVAFMTDIKSMFHQFTLSEGHRDFLAFLWWKDGDLGNEVV